MDGLCFMRNVIVPSFTSLSMISFNSQKILILADLKIFLLNPTHQPFHRQFLLLVFVPVNESQVPASLNIPDFFFFIGKLGSIL